MSTLLVVRHGEATGYGGARIELTAAGRAQARALGEAWAARGVTLAQVAVGPSERHADTAAAVLEALRAAGRPAPAPVVAPELDEYPAVALVTRGLPLLQAGGGEGAALAAALAAAQARGAGAERAFDRVYRHIMAQYAAGALPFADLITFAGFRAGVGRWLDGLCAACPRGATVAAFASAGTVAAFVGHALAAPDDRVLELSFVVRNTSVTELRFTTGRLSLVGFNEVAHLAGAPH
ncbi:MAG TPA: histidine phosphatase family protein [Polyangia bacterium]|jgi:broad specificity phosphatase PhoE